VFNWRVFNKSRQNLGSLYCFILVFMNILQNKGNERFLGPWIIQSVFLTDTAMQ
jgi:hypothetical protein